MSEPAQSTRRLGCYIQILEDTVVTFLRIIEDHSLNDLLHVTRFSSQWPLFPRQKQKRNVK